MHIGIITYGRNFEHAESIFRFNGNSILIANTRLVAKVAFSNLCTLLKRTFAVVKRCVLIIRKKIRGG